MSAPSTAQPAVLWFRRDQRFDDHPALFNPVGQSRKFDPDGYGIRRWVPELAALPSTDIHQPSLRTQGVPTRYPEPVIDHGVERTDALARYHLVRSARDFPA